MHLVEHRLHGKVSGLGMKKMALANGFGKPPLGAGFMGQSQKAGNFFRRKPDHHRLDLFSPGGSSFQNGVFKIMEICLPGLYCPRRGAAGVQGFSVSGQAKDKGEPGIGPGDPGCIIPVKPAAAHADIHPRWAIYIHEPPTAQSDGNRPHTLPARPGKRLFFRETDNLTLRIFYGDICFNRFA